MQKPDGYGKKSSDCGDTIRLFLTVKKGHITDIECKVDGCSFTHACARAVVALAKGRPLADVREWTTPQKIDRILGGLPQHNFHCAELAAEAFGEALTDAIITSRDPWRKLYRQTPE